MKRIAAIQKILASVVFLLTWGTANAVAVKLVSYEVTDESGSIHPRITDGSHFDGGVLPTTATWNWDGTVLTSSGGYTATSSRFGSLAGLASFSDNIIDLAIDTGASAASAMFYECVEGSLGQAVNGNLCGFYDLGPNFTDDSTTIWGPGTAVSQTIGGDDISLGAPRSISAYDYGLDGVTGTGMAPGDFVIIGNGIAVGAPGGEAMTFQVVPIPAAAWLFGSALGLLGWTTRKVKPRTS